MDLRFKPLAMLQRSNMLTMFPMRTGRFITDGGRKRMVLLDALNDPRFLFHSAAPLLTLAGIDLAERAGVSWASSPLFVGGSTLLCLATVMLSTVRNSLLLRTK